MSVHTSVCSFVKQNNFYDWLVPELSWWNHTHISWKKQHDYNLERGRTQTLQDPLTFYTYFILHFKICIIFGPQGKLIWSTLKNCLFWQVKPLIAIYIFSKIPFTTRFGTLYIFRFCNLNYHIPCIIMNYYSISIELSFNEIRQYDDCNGNNCHCHYCFKHDCKKSPKEELQFFFGQNQILQVKPGTSIRYYSNNLDCMVKGEKFVLCKICSWRKQQHLYSMSSTLEARVKNTSQFWKIKIAVFTRTSEI